MTVRCGIPPHHFGCGKRRQVLGNAAGVISDFVALEPDSDELLAQLFTDGQSNVQVYGTGKVTAILFDDLDGSRHQRFIIELKSEQTLLISHNIDLSSRIDNLFLNDQVEGASKNSEF